MGGWTAVLVPYGFGALLALVAAYSAKEYLSGLAQVAAGREARQPPRPRPDPPRRSPAPTSGPRRSSVGSCSAASCCHYAFAHLTLGDFLAAQELYDSPERLLANFRANPEGWREAVKLWCAVASVECTGVVCALFEPGDDEEQLLALECLGDATSVNAGIAESIVAHFLADDGESTRWRSLGAPGRRGWRRPSSCRRSGSRQPSRRTVRPRRLRSAASPRPSSATWPRSASARRRCSSRGG